MTCREFCEFLIDYVADELPAEQKAVFERHVIECRDCRNYLDSYLKTIGMAKAALGDCEQAVEQMPVGLLQAILKARET